jgi:aminopeptidase N
VGTRAGAAIVLGCLACAASGAHKPGQPNAHASDAVRAESRRGYDVRSYKLDLSVDGATGAFAGTVTIALVVTRPALADVELDAVGLDVASVAEQGQPRPFVAKEGHLRVAVDARGSGVHQLFISYRGRPSDGLKFLGDHVYTAYNTRRWMPCNFDPDDKATFDLDLTVPRGWMVLGNGTPSGTKAEGGAETHAWSLREPHSAYLFGFVAGRFVEAERPAADGVPTLEVLATDRTPADAVKRLIDETPGMVRFFEEVSGVPFAGPRYSVAFVGGGAAQELADVSLLGEDYAKDWVASPTEDWLAVHELAHEWWGNRATCATWGDFWIQEALAVYMTAAFKERRWGRPAYERERQLLEDRYARRRAAGRDHALALGPEAREDQITDRLAYSKGALVFFHLRDEVGDQAFWTAVREFTRSAIRSAARTTDLQRAFETAAGHKLLIFERAVYRAGTPDAS